MLSGQLCPRVPHELLDACGSPAGAALVRGRVAELIARELDSAGLSPRLSARIRDRGIEEAARMLEFWIQSRCPTGRQTTSPGRARLKAPPSDVSLES